MTKNKGGFSSWKVQRKTYKERSQPAFRKHLGPLEKHKDYVVRSRKYHQAEEKKKYLQSLARGKNEDEYSIDMNHAHQNDKGITIVEKLPEVKLLPHEEDEAQSGRYELRKPKFHLDRISKKKRTVIHQQSSANLNILKTRWTKVKKDIEKIKEELHFIDINAWLANNSSTKSSNTKDSDDSDNEDDDLDGDDFGEDGDSDMDDDDEMPRKQAAAASAQAAPQTGGRKHVVFVDSDEQLDTFDPQQYFDTHPLLAGRVFNRPRQETLLKMSQINPTETMQMDRKIRQNHKAQLKKLQRLMEQEEQLRTAIHEVEIAVSLATEKDKIESIEKDTTKALVQNPKNGKSALRDEYKAITAIKYKQERRR